jgi:hypothetical protein
MKPHRENFRRVLLPVESRKPRLPSGPVSALRELGFPVALCLLEKFRGFYQQFFPPIAGKPPGSGGQGPPPRARELVQFQERCHARQGQFPVPQQCS